MTTHDTSDLTAPGAQNYAESSISTPLFDIDAFVDARDAETKNSPRLEALNRAVLTEPWRELTRVTASMLKDLTQLERRQPNCAPAIAYVRRQLALSRLATPPVLRWPPLLLDGPPGVGKTFFARALAHALGNELLLSNCSSVTANFVLAGNSPSSGGSRPGRVFEALRDSRYAKPIVLLDEVDKLAGDNRFDGYGPLYQLLEEETARHFVDEHIGLPVDASHIVWLATSNDPDRLPAPIRSRFELVLIDAPTTQERDAIVQSVYENLLDCDPGWRGAFTHKLSAEVIEGLTDLSPREMRRALLSAMGTAALNRTRRRKLRLTRDDLDIVSPTDRAGIGFLS